jgi:hypothetical protein
MIGGRGSTLPFGRVARTGLAARRGTRVLASVQRSERRWPARASVRTRLFDGGRAAG